jgi:hypothetical protein
MSDFEPLSQGIFVRRPVDESSSSLPIVIIFGWMGGDIRYVKKYADLYDGHMVVIVCGGSLDFIRPAASFGYRFSDGTLLPLTKLLASEGCFAGQSSRRCFIHLFSNGGCLRLWSLQQSLYSQKGRRLDVKGMVIDSAPTGGEQPRLTDGVTAFTAGIKNPLLRSLARPFFAIALVTLTLITRLLGITPWHLKARDTLIYDKAPKLFVYSKMDKMVNYRGIDRVIEEVKAKGHSVEKLFFEDSEHVKHLLKYPKEYSDAVKRLLENQK